MSDEKQTETKTMQSQQPVAASKTTDQIVARAEELKKYAGKTFAPNKGDARPVKIVGYGGIKSHIEVRDGKPTQIHSHTFVMENGWTPPATKFLQEWHEVPESKPTEQHPE